MLMCAFVDQGVRNRGAVCGSAVEGQRRSGSALSQLWCRWHTLIVMYNTMLKTCTVPANDAVLGLQSFSV